MTRPAWHQLSLSFKKEKPNESVAAVQRHIVDSDDLTQLTVLAEHLGWNYNAVLTGVYFKIAGDIWKAVLKVEMSSGPKVAYFTGTSLYRLVETVTWYASKALVSWDHDKHPVRVAKRAPYRHPPRRS